MAAAEEVSVFLNEQQHMYTSTARFDSAGPREEWKYCRGAYSTREQKYALSYNAFTGKLLYSNIRSPTASALSIQDVITHAGNIDLEPVLNTLDKNVTAITADWLTGAQYIASSDGTIGVTAVSEGKDLYEPLYESNTTSHGIVVDAEDGLLFWSDSDMQRIMSGPTASDSSAMTIVSHNITTPLGLALDHVNKLLFFGDAETGVIESCGYRGENRELVYRLPLSRPIDYLGITQHQNRLFVTTGSGLDLFVIDKIEKQLITRVELDCAAYGIVTNASVAANKQHDCLTMACDGICFNMGQYHGRCAADEGPSNEPSNPVVVYSVLAASAVVLGVIPLLIVACKRKCFKKRIYLDSEVTGPKTSPSVFHVTDGVLVIDHIVESEISNRHTVTCPPSPPPAEESTCFPLPPSPDAAICPLSPQSPEATTCPQSSPSPAAATCPPTPPSPAVATCPTSPPSPEAATGPPLPSSVVPRHPRPNPPTTGFRPASRVEPNNFNRAWRR